MSNSKNRVRKKNKPRKARTPAQAKKRFLTQDEMLARIPDKQFLTTPEVQHVFNDCHEVTVYKWVRQGALPAFRVRARGKANVYRREDVIDLIAARFLPRPIRRNSSESTDNQIREKDLHEDHEGRSPPDTVPRPEAAKPTRKAKKARKGRE